MIAFITLNSSSIPLIEGLCSSNPCTVDSSSLCYICIFCFSFSEEQTCLRKKQLVQDLIPPPSICTHVYFVHIYEYIYAEI